jgi:4-hydroxy-2-oxoheptanedioate aldolase
MHRAQAMRKKLADGGHAMGSFVCELRTPAVAGFLAREGFDFLLVDTEHGIFDPREVETHIAAAKAAGLCSLVRVSTTDRTEIMRVLDAGAEGIMVPMVRSLEDARRAVAHSKYPPLGQRGAHFARPHTDFGPPADPAAYMAEANKSLLTVVQIETLEAAHLVDELAAVDGVDMLYIGPGDLSIALGHPGQVDHPAVLEVVERMVHSCRRHGKLAASHFNNTDHLPALAERGVQVYGFGAVVRMLAVGVAGQAAAARKALGE